MRNVAMMAVSLSLLVVMTGQAMAQREGRGQRPERPEGGQMRALGPMARVMGALRGVELNEQQRTEVRGMMASAREELQQLGQKAALTDDQREKSRELTQKVMESVRAGSIERGQAREKIAEAIASVQTPEQKKAAAALEEKVEELLGKVKKVMTSEQVEAFEKAMAAPPQRPGRPEGAERPGRGERPSRPEGSERPARGERNRDR